jgi:hypothetical protein
MGAEPSSTEPNRPTMTTTTTTTTTTNESQIPLDSITHISVVFAHGLTPLSAVNVGGSGGPRGRFELTTGVDHPIQSREHQPADTTVSTKAPRTTPTLS